MQSPFSMSEMPNQLTSRMLPSTYLIINNLSFSTGTKRPNIQSFSTPANAPEKSLLAPLSINHRTPQAHPQRTSTNHQSMLTTQIQTNSKRYRQRRRLIRLQIRFHLIQHHIIMSLRKLVTITLVLPCMTSSRDQIRTLLAATIWEMSPLCMRSLRSQIQIEWKRQWKRTSAFLSRNV